LLKVEWGIDMEPEHKEYSTEKICRGPTIMNNQPKDIEAFYICLNEE